MRSLLSPTHPFHDQAPVFTGQAAHHQHHVTLLPRKGEHSGSPSTAPPAPHTSPSSHLLLEAARPGTAQSPLHTSHSAPSRDCTQAPLRRAESPHRLALHHLPGGARIPDDNHARPPGTPRPPYPPSPPPRKPIHPQRTDRSTSAASSSPSPPLTHLPPASQPGSARSQGALPGHEEVTCDTHNASQN